MSYTRTTRDCFPRTKRSEVVSNLRNYLQTSVDNIPGTYVKEEGEDPLVMRYCDENFSNFLEITVGDDYMEVTGDAHDVGDALYYAIWGMMPRCEE